MQTRQELAYCPACQKSVELAWTPEPTHEGHANLHDGEMVCLSCGARCPHGTCPLSGQAHAVMSLRLALSGLTDDVFTARMQCSGCERTTEMKMVDRTTLLCPLCGTVNRWIMMELSGIGWVAIGHLEAS